MITSFQPAPVKGAVKPHDTSGANAARNESASGFGSAFDSVADSSRPGRDDSRSPNSSSDAGSPHASSRFASNLARDAVQPANRRNDDETHASSHARSADHDKDAPDDGDTANDTKHSHSKSANEDANTPTTSTQGGKDETSAKSGSDKDPDSKKKDHDADVPVVLLNQPAPKVHDDHDTASPPVKGNGSAAATAQADPQSGAVANTADQGTAQAAQDKPQQSRPMAGDAKARASADDASPAPSGADKPASANASPKIDVKTIHSASGHADKAMPLHQLFGRLVAAETGENKQDAKGNADTEAEVESAQGKDETASKESKGKERATEKLSETARNETHAGPATPSPAASMIPGTGSGAGQTANTTSIANQMLSQADWTQALSQSAGNPSTGTINTLKVQLNPAHLGTVTANLRVSDGQLVIHLQVQTEEAFRQLSNDSSAIVQKLKGHGYAVETVTIQHVGGNRAATPAPQNQHQGAGTGAQFGNGQGSAGGGQRSGGQSGDGRHPMPAFDQAGSGPGDSSTGDESSNSGRRTGGVYI